MKRATSSLSERSNSPPAKRKASSLQVDLALIEDSNSASSSPVPQQDGKKYAFKNEDFEHSGVRGGKKRIWKNLKNILSSERSLPWKVDDPTYATLDAPPSFRPARKYSDLSGTEVFYLVEIETEEKEGCCQH